MSRSRLILLVEDNPDDVLLTLRAFERSEVKTEIVVARDGEEALDLLFGSGPHKDRELAARTRRLPVVIRSVHGGVRSASIGST